LRPDVQPGITSVEVSAKYPDGRTEVLFLAKDFSLDWPTPYIYREPVPVPRGADLSVVAYSAPPTAGPAPSAFRLTVSGFNK
jgi:hypothetical protein